MEPLRSPSDHVGQSLYLKPVSRISAGPAGSEAESRLAGVREGPAERGGLYPESADTGASQLLSAALRLRLLVKFQ